MLGNAEKRRQYDQFGHAAFGAGGGPQFSNMEDIFSAFGDIFGGGGGGGGIFGDLFGGGSRRRSGPQAGRDLKIVIELSLEEIDTGAKKTVSLKRVERCTKCDGDGCEPGTHRETCGTCGGQGQVARNAGFFSMASTCPTCRGQGQTISSPCKGCKGTGGVQKRKEIDLDLPAGVEEGVRLRVNGEGDAGPPGGPRGDLYVLISESEHKVFQRSGPDVLTEVPFSFPQLAMGDKFEIPTLRGKVEMSVPGGTPSGKVFRLRGQGLPRLEGGGRGDQLVRVFVQVPTKLTDRQRELLTEFGEIDSVESGKKSFFDRVVEYFS